MESKRTAPSETRNSGDKRGEKGLDGSAGKLLVQLGLGSKLKLQLGAVRSSVKVTRLEEVAKGPVVGAVP